jgi:cell division septal protein FtsQ
LAPVARLADAVVLRFPRLRARPGEVVQLLPSWRTLAIAFGGLLATALAYAVARESALFSVQTVQVRGASPAVTRQVETALRPFEGESLLRLDLDVVQSRLVALPTVHQASLDRAFPHTLRVSVAAERPVAVLRRGSEAWLVSARGRVLRPLPRPRLSRLPRVWVPLTVAAEMGDLLTDSPTLRAVRALAAVSAGSALGARVEHARANDRELTLVLAAGTELRLANESELELKLAVARQVLRALQPTANGWPAYVDLTVPGRPVAGETETQVVGET